MSPRFDTSKVPIQHRLNFNVDAVAITVALAFALLIRLNVIHHISW